MRWAVFLVVVLAGCTPRHSVEQIEPFIAVAGTYAVIASSTTPVPTPVQGDVCPSCYGRGIVGDQTNMVTCQTCGGTGKVVKHAPVVIHPPECKDGKCQQKKSTAR